MMFFNVSPMPFELGDWESAEVRLFAGCASKHFWYRSWKEIRLNLLTRRVKHHLPCKQLRWFYIKHHCSAHSGMSERRTCLEPCGRWRRSFWHSSQCPENSSSERELQQLFGHRPERMAKWQNQYRGERRFTLQPTPLGRTAIIEGEMDTLTLVQLSGAASALTFSMASLMVFIPTACWTSQQPRYWALRTFFGSSMGVGKDCAVEGKKSMSLELYSMHCYSPCLIRRWRFSVGKSVGLTARLVDELHPSNCTERSIMIFLQISLRKETETLRRGRRFVSSSRPAYLNVLAIVRAAVSQRNTWHMWTRVKRSRATYAKSLTRKGLRLVWKRFRRRYKKWKVMLMRNDPKKTRHQLLTALWEHLKENGRKCHESVLLKKLLQRVSQKNLWRTHLPLSRPTPQTRIVWIGCVFRTVKFSGSISFKAPSSKSKNKSLPYKSICDMISF